MRIRAALQGDLQKMMQQEAKDATAGVKGGVDQAGGMLKAAMRQQTKGAGLEKLAKAWQSRTYENKGLDAAALVYSKAPKIHAAFNEGATIRAKKGRFLAIPTPEAKKRTGVGKRQKLSPRTFPGKLRYVPRPNGPDLLVEDEVKILKSGRVNVAKRTKTGRLGRGSATVVMFLLVPQVTLKKRLDVQGAAARVQNILPRLIQQHYKASPEKS